MCYCCDRPGPRDQPWPHHLNSRNNRRWRWTANRCSSTKTCPCPSDCPMSKSRICCSRHFANTGSSIQLFPLFRMMPTAGPTSDSTDMPRSSSAPANMDSFGWQNIERRLIEWLWFVDLLGDANKENVLKNNVDSTESAGTRMSNWRMTWLFETGVRQGWLNWMADIWQNGFSCWRRMGARLHFWRVATGDTATRVRTDLTTSVRCPFRHVHYSLNRIWSSHL